MSGAPRDPWERLGVATPARIALGRAGASLPTREVLDFALAHARARDAVHAAFEPQILAAQLADRGLETIGVQSSAPDRATYLRRPDLGRRLSEASRTRLLAAAAARPPDIVLVVADGLSATAVYANAVDMVAAFQSHCARNTWAMGPVILATRARVALGDEIGLALGAKLVVVLIGERPGLSAADSLGAYLTYDPQPGRTDAERNCISNIRQAGLDPEAAAANLAWLANAALEQQATGVHLKDESDKPATIAADDGPKLGTTGGESGQ